MKKDHTGCLTALLLLLAFTGRAQAEQLPIKTYTVADGLAHDSVKRIIQDSRGFLWFCTPYGLSRFDGYRFTNYGVEEGLSFPSINDFVETRDGGRWVATNGGGVCRFSPRSGSSAPATGGAGSLSGSRFIIYPVGDSPPASRVNKLYEDRAGRLWAGTDAGLFHLDADGGAFQRAELGVPRHPDTSVQVWAFVEDREGSLWIATTFGLLRRLPDGRTLHYSVQPFQNRDAVWTLLLGREGELWLGHEAGLITFTPQPAAELSADSSLPNGSPIRPINPQSAIRHPQSGGAARRYTTADGLSRNDVRSLCQAADGRIWIGTNEGGLTVYNGKDFHTYTTGQGVRDNLTMALAEDRAGNLWAGTKNGALKIPQSGFATYTQADGLVHDFIHSIFEDRAGELHVIAGAWRIHRLDGTRFAAVRPNLPGRIPDSSWRSYRSILQDRAGEWWVATNEGLYRFPRVTKIEQLARVRPRAVYTTRDGLADNNVAQLFEDARGDVWIGTFAPGQEALTRWERATGKFYRYSEADGLPPFNAAAAFCEDAAGNLWVGFREGGLARYGAGRFTLLGAADGVPSGTIIFLYADRAGRLWVASQLAGLSRIDNPAADRPGLVTYTVADGLASNYVSYITEDDRGRLYVGTARGMDRLDPATGGIRHYTSADGLADVRVFAAFRDRRGALWFGTSQGLSKFTPPPDRVQPPPPVFIGGLRIAGVPYQVSDLGETSLSGLELEASQNQVQIDFFGLGFGPGETLRYQYRLEGANQEWSAPAEQRAVDFASLAPGKYRFLVRAVSADGAFSRSPATVTFTILPPVWRRWWFVTLAAIMIGAVIYAFARSRLARVKALRESEARFRTLAETASDAIITINEASVIVFVNPAAENVFGYTAQEMLGRDLTMLMPEYLRHLHRAGFDRYRRTGQKHISWEAIELPGLHKGGREIPLEISFGEFTRDGAQFFTGIARDITERKRAEEALLRSKEERLVEIEQVRRRIATDLHDDIGSSLTQISILSEVARRSAARDDVAETEPLSMIASASRELVDSMSDIVWAINPKKDHLSDLTQRMRHFASDIFTARRIKFRLTVPGAEHDIRIGANLRREVFLIFKESVNNLVRHSGCTEADIEFRVEGDWLFLRVSDNGKGFDVSTESDGHGLLSMRERARDSGGEFEVRSNHGKGTTVRLKLPLGRA